MTHSTPPLVIFDLDGTLLNTIADLGCACNYALSACCFPTHQPSEYPHMVGNGVNKLLERALPADEQTADNIQRLRPHFIEYYNHHNTVNTAPYDGISRLLSTLKQQGVKTAVASNKYQAATQHLVEHYFPALFDCILGEREGVPRKPEPQIIADIQRLTAPSTTILYVGDSAVDAQTARNARLPFAACTWGFETKQNLLRQTPDYMVDNAKQLLAVIQSLI